MAKAVKKEPTFQIECRTDQQWRQLCKKDGLIVVDVYAGWTGPCSSIINFLKRVKADIVPVETTNKLTFAIASSDRIDDLIGFRDQSEPTWLFLAGGGKPIRVMRGCHVPNLAKAIKDELEHELLCMEGKARRNYISIDDEESRKKKMEGEVMRLGDMLKDEDPSADESARRESSVQLETVMAAYTIAVVQPFLHNRLTEIKEYLIADFNILATSTIKIDDESARKIYRIPQDITLPKDVIGKTTFILLESTEIKKILEGGSKPSGALQTADDWLRLKVGPRVFEQALEHSPDSLVATYGKKGQYVSGVWCPRRYDDKRFILLTYFSEFMVDKMIPLTPEGNYTTITEKFTERTKERIPGREPPPKVEEELKIDFDPPPPMTMAIHNEEPGAKS